MKKIITVLLFFVSPFLGISQSSPHDLHFNSLSTQWYEAIPLGNGMLGALIWQKNNHLRFSLDRADLWDLRPMKGLHRPEFSYSWVVEQVNKKDYKPVQEYFDAPYDREAAPSKIPGGALEFDTKGWGYVRSVQLFLSNALCEVKWTSGIVLKTFVHATEPVGWFRFENITTDFMPKLIAPKYQKDANEKEENDDLSRLGYKHGEIQHGVNSITYNQPG